MAVKSKASMIDELLDERNDLKRLFAITGDIRYLDEIDWVDEKLRRLVVPFEKDLEVLKDARNQV